MTEISREFIQKGINLKHRENHAREVIGSLSVLGLYSLAEKEMKFIISEWENHCQIVVNKLSQFLPFLFEDFAKNKNGTLLGTYYTYYEMKNLSDDENFNENCVVIKIGIEYGLSVKDGISTEFVYNFLSNEFFIWSYIGTDGIYASKNYNREYIREQIRNKVPVKVIWRNSKGF